MGKPSVSNKASDDRAGQEAAAAGGPVDVAGEAHPGSASLEARVYSDGERWRALTESAVDAIITADADGVIRDWNRGAEAIFGYRKEEVLGRSLTELMPEPYRGPHERGMRRHQETGEDRVIGHTVELYGLRRSGEEFPLELSLSSWRVGEDVYYSAIIRDITERRRAEAALRRQTELVRLLQEIAMAANEATELRPALQFALERICRFTGWPVGHVYVPAEEGSTELIPTAIWCGDDPERYRKFREVTQRTRLQAGVGLPGLVRASGRPVWIEDVTTSPNFPRAQVAADLRVRSGFAFPVLLGREVLAILEFFEEKPTPPDDALLEAMGNIGTQLGRVAERQRAERSLRDRERQLARAQEIAHLGSWEWNVETGALVWSDELYRIYGLTPGTPVSFAWFIAHVHPEDRAMVQTTVERSMQTGEPFSYHHRIRRDDGTERILLAEGEVERDEAGRVLRMYGIGQDVTEARRTEEELRRRNAQNTALISALPDVLLRLSSDGFFLDYIEPQGFKAAQPAAFFLGKNVREVLSASLAEETLVQIRRALETGTAQVFEYEIMVDGELRYREARLVQAGADEVLAIMRDITDRKRAELALLESEERFRVLSESAFEGIFVLEEGVIRDANSRAAELFGFDSVAEVVGRRAVDLVAPDSAEIVADMIRRNAPGMYKATLLRPDGTTFQAELQGRRVIINGRQARVTAVRDITERARSEEALRDRERQLARAQEIAHLGSWEWNVETGALVWSDELYRIYGLTPGEGISFERYLAMVHPEDRDRVRETIREVLQGQQPFAFEERIIRPDGTERILSTAGEVVMEEGEVVRLTGVCHDVTEARRAEAELRESERRFRLLAENMSDVVSLHSPEGHYLYVSSSCTRIFGYEPEELVGVDPYSLMHPDDIERIRTGAHRAILEGQVGVTDTYRFRQKSGEYLWVETATKPIPDERGEIVMIQASTRDVHERVLAEQALERTNVALQQRNRELQDFAYVASHDLQEPLRKIHAFADLLQEDHSVVLDESGQYYLRRMQEAAARMSNLISDLLAFSRVTTRAKPFERVDLEEVMENVRSDLELLLAESRGTLEVGPLPSLEADPTQMHQLLQNLLGNALKFAREGVPPVVQVHATLERGSTASGGADMLHLTVRDNGIGFDEKYLDRIFTPFQRLHNKERYGGTGMGLAICRRIVERHHGTITASSRPGEGSTFIVLLPLRQEAAADAEV